MKFKEFREVYKKDLEVYRKGKSVKRNIFLLYMMNPGLKLVTCFRICRFLNDKKALFPLYCFIRFHYRHLCVKFSIDMPSHAHIGGGLYIPHALAGGIVVNGDAVIGEYATLLSGVVIGGNHTGVPTIGQHVFFGANSVTIGNIHVGDYSVIGAGATVTHNVAAKSVAIGPSAKEHKSGE